MQNDLICKAPEIPVGGRLTQFLDEWKMITSDKWVLAVIENGLALEFISKPPCTGIIETRASVQHLDILQKEVKKLLEKNAIEPVPVQEINEGFYSTFFIVPKKTGDLRPVINLRPLNRHLRKQHFKMDCLGKVMKLVRKGDWAVSIDLKDAYLHIPILKQDRKFLRFCIQGKAYQFTCLCFGPTMAPRVFTKVLSVVTAHLRMFNIRLASYLDDWLLLNALRNQLLKNLEMSLNLLLKLGFIVNREKSSLTPCQNIVYIGAHFFLDRGIACPTLERIEKIKLVCHSLKTDQTARNFLSLLGLMASCIQLVPNARLHMRPIQLHLLKHWKPSTMSLNCQIPYETQLQNHLQWWLDKSNLLKGEGLINQESDLVLTTDASKLGYGAHLENHLFQGEWSQEEKKWHINNLELEAVFRAIKHFLPKLVGHQLLIRSDNTSVVQYLNKQGGTKSIQLCHQAWELWNFAIAHNIGLKAAHIAGKKNCLADSLSRVHIRHTEWSLKNTIVEKIFALWGKPMVDLFASEANKKLQTFCTWIPSRQAMAVDALTISWEGMEAYAFPPICLIPKVLQHMQKFNCQIILIAPLWPRRNWYTDLLQWSIDYPRTIPVDPNLLCQPKTNIYHPNPQVFQLTAWLLSTNLSKIKGFQETLETCCLPLGDQVHKKITPPNLADSVAGVLNGKLIHLKPL